MSELYPALLPFAACIIFFVAWLSQQKKSVRKQSTVSTVANVPQREEVVVPERSVEPALQTWAA